jgi:DNA-binding NtrC family response regulator
VRALELRRDAGLAAEIPGHWLLDSPGVAHVLDTAKRLARAPGAPILIEGERGAGVPELARFVHNGDPIARAKRFRAMTAHLINPSEIRGWAAGGTLLIEDLENLSPAAQTWLGELLASRTELAQPLRIIGGSQRSASELWRHIGLSQELVHALDVGRLVIPPLRDRVGDILKLARRFLEHCATWQHRRLLRFSEAAERRLLAHTYPANVRELRNVVERAAALATSEEIGDDAIVFFEDSPRSTSSGDLLRPSMVVTGPGEPRVPTLAQVEREYLVMLIREFRGRRTAMSRAMGVSYPTVLKKIANHGLNVRAIVEAAAPPVGAAG